MSSAPTLEGRRPTVTGAGRGPLVGTVLAVVVNLMMLAVSLVTGAIAIAIRGDDLATGLAREMGWTGGDVSGPPYLHHLVAGLLLGAAAVVLLVLLRRVTTLRSTWRRWLFSFAVAFVPSYVGTTLLGFWTVDLLG